MIQRLQTILLFLAAGLMVVFLYLPTWMVMNPEDGEGGSKTLTATPMSVEYLSSRMSLDDPFTEDHFDPTENTFLLIQFASVGLIVLLLVVNIFLYKNRGLQIKLAYLAILLFMVQFVMMVPIRSWLQELGGDPTAAGDTYQSLPQWGLAAPLLALLLTWWAIKRIQKDEKLVRGMDRIR